MQRIFGIALQRHEMLEIKHEVGPFVEARQDAERALEFERAPPRLRIARRGAFAERDEMQHFPRQHVADAGDGAARPAIDVAVEHLRVDADHQRDFRRSPGDVLGGVAQRLRAAEFLEADEVRISALKSKNSSARVSKP